MSEKVDVVVPREDGTVDHYTVRRDTKGATDMPAKNLPLAIASNRGHPLFQSTSDDDARTSVVLDRALWINMGRPNKITITVAPDDNPIREADKLTAVMDDLVTKLRQAQDQAHRDATERRWLLSIVESHLRANGFTTDDKGWGHPALGQGRTFKQAVTWWIEKDTDPEFERLLAEEKEIERHAKVDELIAELREEVRKIS